MDRTPTQQLLDFICDQELDLSQYMTLVEPINKKFYITELINGTEIPATVQCVERIIRWENGEQDCSLEQTINNRYKVYDQPREKVFLTAFQEHSKKGGKFYTHAKYKDNG